VDGIGDAGDGQAAGGEARKEVFHEAWRDRDAPPPICHESWVT
jgi:hypothetical protein